MSLAAPPRPSDVAGDGRGPGPAAPPPSSRTSSLPAEVALCLTTAAAVVGYVRVFEGTGFLPKLLVAALGGHLIAALLRRRRAPMLVTVVLLYLGFLLVASWALFPSTTVAGLPTLATARALVDAVSTSWTRVGEEVAPVDPEPGFLVVAFLATWVSAVVADRAAFRWWMTLQALVPATSLFVVGALLARGGDHPEAFAGGFLAASLAFLLLQRPLVFAHRLRWRWMALGEAPGVRATRTTGALLLVVCCTLGAAVGPQLPGGDGTSLVDWRPGEGGGRRQTVSPLVDIRSRLVDQSDQVLFTVDATAPAYWRVTSLDVFDGRVWRSEGSFQGAGGELERPDDEVVGDDQLVQEIQVEALDQIWLPAAFRPVSIDTGDTPVRYDPESGTLIVDRELESSDGASYTVRSAVPDLDPADLEAATDPPPPEVAGRYLALPDDFSVRAQRVAEEATAGAQTPYQQALALEAYFQDGFEYSLEVPDGHDEAAIDAFLIRRVGYCEQFAGTYAAMARSLGLPSRVAVGYTPGDLDLDVPGRHLVRGRDSHAWPEVWLTGIGWVAMEPTPTRDQPVVAPATTTPTTIDPSTPTTAADEPTSPPTEPPGGAEEQAAPPTSGSTTPPWLLPAVLATLAVALVAAVPLLLGLRRRQLLGHGSPGERVQAAWAFATDDLAAAGLRSQAADTPVEVAQRAADLRLLALGPVERLAKGVTAARFAPDVVDEQVAQQAAIDAEAVTEAVDDRLEPGPRWRRRFDARRLWRR